MPKLFHYLIVALCIGILALLSAMTGRLLANRFRAPLAEELMPPGTTANRLVPEVAKRTGATPHFRPGTDCAVCHSNSNRATAMRDARGRSIAPFDLWQASMMANSSRDPFWRAVLSAEVAATPSQKALIEEKCTRCHAPMAAPAPVSPKGDVLAYLKKGDRRSHLGLDGVSCTVCHQITDKGLGTKESFTGNFEINKESRIFGPHANPFPRPMQNRVGYTPTEGNHILKSGLCATCHMVITSSLDSDGRVAGHDFHEQAPYLEWRNSVFNDELASPSGQAMSCQACHMPVQDEEGNKIETRLAHNPGGMDFPFLKPRSPFGRHTFSGANTLMQQILRDNREALDIVAPASAFNESIEQTRRFLKTRSATIELNQRSIESGAMIVSATIRNLGGHKLPTAYPSRRIWIHFTVVDGEGKEVFVSGRYNGEGELVDSRNQVFASELVDGPVIPHRQMIDEPDQVQVYETIMADPNGDPTFTLLRGASYVKDNRLLPLGWTPDHPDGQATRPYGIGEDPDFLGGSDSLVYRIPQLASGRYVVTARLMLQIIAPRHANELFQFQTEEVDQFKKMYEAADRSPEELASSSLEIMLENPDGSED